MKLNKFLIILSLSFSVYFIFGYIFSDIVFYVIGSFVGGTIKEGFELIGIDAGTTLIGSVWTIFLAVFIMILFLSDNNIVIYSLIFLIGLLLYVLDISFAFNSNFKKLLYKSPEIINLTFVFAFSILKSVIITVIIYNKIIKKNKLKIK